jgi:hypothetical protein
MNAPKPGASYRLDGRVDRVGEAAARFYRHHGFQAFSGGAERLFLPVATALEGGGGLSGALLGQAVFLAAVLFHVQPLRNLVGDFRNTCFSTNRCDPCLR